MSPVEITSSSTKSSSDNRYDPSHAIDGNFESLYYSTVFNPSITKEQPYWIKVSFGGTYYIRYIKYKVTETNRFYVKIGSYGAYDDMTKNLFVGGFTGNTNYFQMLWYDAEIAKGSYAFVYDGNPAAEFHLYEIQFWGLRAA